MFRNSGLCERLKIIMQHLQEYIPAFSWKLLTFLFLAFNNCGNYFRKPRKGCSEQYRWLESDVEFRVTTENCNAQFSVLITLIFQKFRRLVFTLISYCYSSSFSLLMFTVQNKCLAHKPMQLRLKPILPQLQLPS